jgi:FkbM family methyltransferase
LKNEAFGKRDVLTTILRPDRLTAIVDIGANPIDGTPPYKAMLEAGLCEVIGFEPQSEALSRLKKTATRKETYLPHVVADGKEGTLHICKASGMTSLLKPDPRQLALFNLFPEFGTVLEERKMNTIRLDDIKEISKMDFLKIDIQGSELTVFSNGRKRLGEAVAVQTEVSFIPLYAEQPTFDQIDNFLRKLDYVPHRFLSVKRWALSPTVFSNEPRIPGNQLLEADIVYVKDFSNLSVMDSEKIRHLALLSHHVFGSVDLANLALIELQRRGDVGRDSVQRYQASVAARPPR